MPNTCGPVADRVFAMLLFVTLPACNQGEPSSSATRGDTASRAADRPMAEAPAAASTAMPADPWSHADSLIMRLSPDAFADLLPPMVIDALHERGCTVPQATELGAQPHNVVRGAFTRAGQDDWAVLCSRRGSSAILVFRGGSAHDVAELAEAEDRASLQGVGNDRIEFSRAIRAADADYIRRQHANHPGSTAPPAVLDHAGIEDRFLGKASAVHYFDNGRWLILQAAD